MPALDCKASSYFMSCPTYDPHLINSLLASAGEVIMQHEEN